MAVHEAGTGFKHVDDGSVEAIRLAHVRMLAAMAEAAKQMGLGVELIDALEAAARPAPLVTPPVPPALRAWAVRVVEQRADETDATSILTGVTLGDLRAWVMPK